MTGRGYLTFKRITHFRRLFLDFDDIGRAIDPQARSDKPPVPASGMTTPWPWTLAFGQHEDQWPTHGYAATREAAMAAFAKSWRREWF
jgi:hypothetical protein